MPENSHKKTNVLRKAAARRGDKGLVAARGAEFCGRTVNVSLYFLLFSLPLFFLPFTAEVLEFNKQMLLVALSLTALFAWLFKAALEKKIELVKTPLNALVGIFLLTYGLAALFSVDKYQSLIGSYDRSGDSWLTVFCLAVLFFLIVNNAGPLKRIKRWLVVFLLSGFLSALLGIMQMSGARWIPLSLAQNKSFNTVGTLNALAIFLAGGFCLALVWLLNPYFPRSTISSKHSPGNGFFAGKILLAILGLTLLVAAILVNYWAVWLGLTAVMILLLVFANFKIREFKNVNWLVIPVVILILSALLSFARFPWNLNLPVEIIPTQQAGWQIAQNVLAANPLWGSGPGTFAFDYAKYRSLALNETPFWNVSFSQGSSEFITLLATVGILGLVSWIFLTLGFLAVAIHFFFRQKDGERWFLGLGIFFAWTLFFILKFFYPANLILDFSAWTLMGFFAAVVAGEKRSIRWECRPRVKFLVAVALTSFIFIFCFTVYAASRRYAAEIYCQKAQLANQKGEPLEKVIGWLEISSAYDEYQDNIHRNLAQAYLAAIAREAVQASGSSAPQNIQALTDSALRAAKRAAELNPANAANWLTLGDIYQAVMPLIKGSDVWAVSSYRKALALEPNNPAFYVSLGNVYLAQGDLADTAQEAGNKERADAWRSARENFNQAIELKADYAPAYFQLSAVCLREGQAGEAIEKMLLSQQCAPNDASMAFNLGALYAQMGEDAKAAAALARALQLSPDYANARWLLASIYERQGRTPEAISILERVVELNPGNATASAKLESLKKSLNTPPPPAAAESAENTVPEEQNQ